MERWWCIDCLTEVELNQQARCGCCDSEAVDSMARTGMALQAGQAAFADGGGGLQSARSN